jgi:hypothetical protein
VALIWSAPPSHSLQLKAIPLLHIEWKLRAFIPL